MAWGGIKRDKRDIAFSFVIRNRDGWRCRRCRRDFSSRRGSLDCSHYHGRRKKSVRWDLKNAFAHCKTCHRYFSENPSAFTAWVKKELGEKEYDLLLFRANRPARFTKFDLEMIYKDLKQQRKHYEDLYNNGSNL